jgi:hypothetical protein
VRNGVRIDRQRLAGGAWLFVALHVTILVLAGTDTPGSSTYARAHTSALLFSLWGTLLVIAVAERPRVHLSRLRTIVREQGPLGVMKTPETPVCVVASISVLSALFMIDWSWVGGPGAYVGPVVAFLTVRMIWELRRKFTR